MVLKMVLNRLAHSVILLRHNHNISPNFNKQMPLDNEAPYDPSQGTEAHQHVALPPNNNQVSQQEIKYSKVN